MLSGILAALERLVNANVRTGATFLKNLSGETRSQSQNNGMHDEHNRQT